MIEQPLLSTDELLAALTFASNAVPTEALRQARERWPEVAEKFLDMLRRAADVAPEGVIPEGVIPEGVIPEGEIPEGQIAEGQIAGGKMTEAETDTACFAVYLAAQARDTRAFPLLCALGHHPSRLADIIGDGITEDIEALLIRLFDGDITPLQAMIEAAHGDEFAREGALYTLAWLTAEGRIPRQTMRDYLAWLLDHLEPQKDRNAVWFGWQSAVAALGLAEFAPQVRQLLQDGRIAKRDLRLSTFEQHVAEAQAASDPLAPFEAHIGPRIEALDDSATFIGSWAAFEPEQGSGRLATEPPQPPAGAAHLVWDGGKYVNPHRHVGRNDPCPCGSGKKYKKCCLGSAHAS